MERIKSVLSCDTRSLALLRIGLGLYVVLDVLFRALQFPYHYANDGIFPIELARRILDDQGAFSLYVLVESDGLQLALFAITFALGALLVLGWRTRWLILPTYVLLFSLQNRLVVTFYPGDFLSRTLLLLGAFLPLSEQYSLDARRDRRPPRLVCHAGTAGLVLFVCAFMLFTGLTKTGPSWRDGTAVFYVLNNIRDSNHILDFVLDKPWLFHLLTWSTVIVEIAGAVALLSPFATPIVRTCACLVLALFLVGFGLGINVWLLPFLQAAALLALLPPWFWDRFLRAPRTAFGRSERAHTLPVAHDRPATLPRKLVRSVAIVLTTSLLLHHCKKIGEAGHFDPDLVPLPRFVDRGMFLFGVQNAFAMYRAPEKNSNGWDTIVGTYRDGTELNLRTRDRFTQDAPASANAHFGTFWDKRIFRYLNWSVPGANTSFHVYKQDMFAAIARHYCRREPALDALRIAIAQHENVLPPVMRGAFSTRVVFTTLCASMR